jgi:hypothetical protein
MKQQNALKFNEAHGLFNNASYAQTNHYNRMLGLMNNELE